MKRIKQMFRRHWNCIPWIMCGALVVADGEVNIWQYLLAVLTIVVLIWLKLPIGKDD